MLFEDIFYPENPKRREEVRNYQAALRNALINYQSSWNGLVEQISPILASLPDKTYSNIRLQKLDYDVKTTEVKECISRINNVAQNTKSQFEKLFNDIGLPPLPDFDNIKTEKDIAGKIHFYVSQLPTLILDTVVSTAVAAIVSAAIRLLALVAGLGNAATFVASTLFSFLLGGVAFILTDLAVSAITGAIERKALRDAIAAYEEVDTKVTKPLLDAIKNIAGVSQCFKDGVFRLGDDKILMRRKDGTWVIVEL